MKRDKIPRRNEDIYAMALRKVPYKVILEYIAEKYNSHITKNRISQIVKEMREKKKNDERNQRD